MKIMILISIVLIIQNSKLSQKAPLKFAEISEDLSNRLIYPSYSSDYQETKPSSRSSMILVDTEKPKLTKSKDKQGKNLFPKGFLVGNFKNNMIMKDTSLNNLMIDSSKYTTEPPPEFVDFIDNKHQYDIDYSLIKHGLDMSRKISKQINSYNQYANIGDRLCECEESVVFCACDEVLLSSPNKIKPIALPTFIEDSNQSVKQE